MRQETFTLSQKELQRVSVISACIKGDMACARAAVLLCLSVRQVKRLKKRMRAAKALGDSTNRELKGVKKRIMSAAARAKIGKAAKKRWAKFRAQTKKVTG